MKRAPLLFLAIAACGGPSRPVPTSIDATKEVTTYWVGTSQVLAPDRVTPYGPEVEAVAQRVVSPRDHRVVETVVVDEVLFVTTLSQTGDEHVFTASADGDAFTGTLTFTGPPWSPTGWDYDLALSEGRGRITGHADLSATELTTEKHFVGPDGADQAVIVERLHAVPEAEYADRRDALVAVTTYYAGTAIQWTPDHREQVGTQAVLRQRTLHRASRQIRETLVVQGQVSIDVYTQTDDAAVFVLAPEGGLSGKRTVHGPAWAWTSYDDDLTVQDLEMHIHGDLTADGITSSSTVSNSDGVVGLLETTYRVISETEFREGVSAQTADR